MTMLALIQDSSFMSGKASAKQYMLKGSVPTKMYALETAPVIGLCRRRGFSPQASVILSPSLCELNETHTPVWLHANNYCPAEVAGNFVFASSMEVLYLNNSCYEFAKGEVKFPWALDMPNNPEAPEIVLGDFC